MTQEQLKRAEAFAQRMPEIPLAILLATGAITPALCEEWFFRGFVMSSLRKLGPWTAIVGSASLFAMMHVLTSNMLSLERLLPSLFMGLVLGLIAWRTGTIWPGMLLHSIHNGLLLSIGHFKRSSNPGASACKKARIYRRCGCSLVWLLSPSVSACSLCYGSRCPPLPHFSDRCSRPLSCARLAQRLRSATQRLEFSS